MKRASITSKAIVPFSVSLLLFSCNNNENKQTDKQADSTQAVSTIIPRKDTLQVTTPALLLKNRAIDEKYFDRQTKRASVLTKEQFTALGAEKLLPGGQLKYEPEMKLKIIDTVFSGNNTWVIISRETENELWAWLAALDGAKKITSSKLVFYQDFVEYFSATSARITDTSVVITTVQDNGESKSKKSEKFRFTDSQQLSLIK